MIEKIKALAKEVYPELIKIRRHMHMYPELSFQEYETAKFIKSVLASWSIDDVQTIANTGVMAKIYGKNPGKKNVALRADIDALPIPEQNKTEYVSRNPGIMHACGHDFHTASLLGTAYILNKLRDEWEGTFTLVFQPGEEKLPGGATLVIGGGHLDNPRPDYILGQHVEPEMEVGKIGVKTGVFMASADEIYITVNGKGGHGAKPHQCIDTILIASQMIVGLQQIVSRRAEPTMPTVLTFGKINSDGGATNVIPSKVFIEGTLRTFDEKWRFEAQKLIKDMAQQLCSAMGGSCDIRIDTGYPFVYNHEALTREMTNAAKAFLGEENILAVPARMGAEDFAYYSQIMPASFYRLGTKNPNGTGLHSPIFEVDESALEIGAGLMAWLGVNDLLG
jgi:amidohydrolase